MGRLGYDLEGKCKDIVARRKARGGGGGGGGAKGGRSSPNTKGSAARRGTGSSSRSVAPNYTSESVIEDIYGGVAAQQAGTGSRDRATRASRRSASAVSWGIPASVSEHRIPNVLKYSWFVCTPCKRENVAERLCYSVNLLQ